MYRPWLPLVGSQVELLIGHLPGRESRWSEPTVSRISDIADAFFAAIRPEADKPLVLFGHSLGGLIAFELSRRLVRAGVAPRHVFVSAHRAPRLPNRHPRVSHLTDTEFIKTIAIRHGGIPDEVASNRELMDLMLPSLRADYRAFEDYTYEPAPPLPCPVTALGGTRDEYVTRDDLEPWRNETSAAFSLLMFDGGHFYVNDLRPAVVSALAPALQAPGQ